METRWLVVDGVPDPNWTVVDGKQYPVMRTLLEKKFRRPGAEILCSYEDEEGELYLWVECRKCGPDGSSACAHRLERMWKATEGQQEGRA